MTLTREQVLEMGAGREMDKQIEEKVFKEDLTDYQWSRVSHSMYRNQNGGVNWIDIPTYSTDISAAWEVVEKIGINKINFEVLRRSDGQYFATCKKVGSSSDRLWEKWAESETAPLAICRVALLTTIGEGTECQ